MEKGEKIIAKIADTAFVADDSQKAADRAIEYALAGKNKDARFNGMLSGKSFLHGNATMDSYSDTFNKTYDAVLQAKAFKAVMDSNEDIQQPDNYTAIDSEKQNNTMSNQQHLVNPNSLKAKRDLLIKLAQYMEGVFIPQLDNFKNRYDNQVASLGGAGMFQEFHQKFSTQCKQVTIDQIFVLKKKIIGQDLPYIYRAIKYYNGMIEKYSK